MLTFASRPGLRRAAAAVVIVAATALLLPAPASAVPAATTGTSGLFGAADPTYDGVYRQSMAILGLRAAKAPVPAPAVAWLAGQQCADGSFEAFRADRTQPCGPPDPATFTGPDSNSTALAAMALRAVGRAGAADRAVAVLRAKQNTDGGWGYTLGSGSDVNSTGLALAAVRGARASGASVARATSFLRAAQVPCTSPVETRFALPYQPGQAANASASVQGLLGLAGTLPTRPIAASRLGVTTCRSPFIERVATYVDRTLRANGGAIPSSVDSSQADWNSSATGVIALASAGAAPAGIRSGISALGRNVAAYAGTGASASPGALGTLIQAAVAAGARPRAFGAGNTNLVTALLGTLQR